MTGSKDDKSVPTQENVSNPTTTSVEEAETNTNPVPFLIGVGVVAVIAVLATKIDLYSMDQLLGGLTFLGLLSFLIIAHEMGHFWVAKKCGMKVERFGFGLPFGPTLWSKKYGETEYCIHACLLGGYVGFPDDDPDSDLPEDSPVRFENQPIWNRFAVAIAGIVVNAILAVVILFSVYMIWGKPTGEIELNVTDMGAYEQQVGFQQGDNILKLNDVPVKELGTSMDDKLKVVMNTVDSYANKPITLELLRIQKSTTMQKIMAAFTGKTVADETSTRETVTVTPNAEGKIGVALFPVETPDGNYNVAIQQLMPGGTAAGTGIVAGDVIMKVADEDLEHLYDFKTTFLKQLSNAEAGAQTVTVKRNTKEIDIKYDASKNTSQNTIDLDIALTASMAPYASPATAMKETVDRLSMFVYMNFQALGQLAMGKGDPSQLSGPGMITVMGAQIIQEHGIQKGLELTAIISMILAVMNLLPIPALDGGHILFILIEAIKGSPLKKERREIFTQIGFVGLLMLMAFVIFNDLNNILFNPIQGP